MLNLSVKSRGIKESIEGFGLERFKEKERFRTSILRGSATVEDRSQE